MESDATTTPRSGAALLSAPEEIALAARIRGGDRAAHHTLVLANVRLVGAVARRYQGRGLAWEDLVQEGVCGLIRAAGAYDPAHGTRFATYATWWIRATIRRAIEETGRMIRVPSHLYPIVRHLQRVEQQLAQDLGRHPTPAEVGAAAGLPAPTVDRLQAAWLPPRSLDTPAPGDPTATVGACTPDPAALDPAAVAAQRALRAALEELLTQLPPAQAGLLRQHYGFDTGTPIPFPALAARLGLARSTVYKQGQAALGQLRTLAAGNSDELKAYLDA